MAFFKTYALYFKLALIGVVVLAASYFAWNYSRLQRLEEISEAVNDTAREFGRALDTERDRNQQLRKAIDDRYIKLDKTLARIEKSAGNARAGAKADIDKNPQFYKQPLPDEGYKQWLNARRMAAGAAEPPASPASSPASSPAQ